MKPVTILVLALMFFCLSLPLASAASITVPASVTLGDTATFVFNNPETLGGVVTSYLWNFGDGATANTTDTNTTHVYSSASTYSVSCTVAYSMDAGEDWNVSSDWDLTETFSDTITVASDVTPTPDDTSEARTAANGVITNMYIVVTLLSVSLIVLAAGLIMNSLKNGDADSKMVYGGIVVLIVSVIILVVGFNIVNTLEKSFDSLFFSLIIYIH
jgi:hypothetical protein